MRIVINIPEEQYKRICDHTDGVYDMVSLLTIIENGTPLQKGHGKLVDVEDVKDNIRKWRGYLDEDMIGRINFAMDHHIPIIIEAIKEDN